QIDRRLVVAERVRVPVVRRLHDERREARKMRDPSGDDLIGAGSTRARRDRKRERSGSFGVVVDDGLERLGRAAGARELPRRGELRTAKIEGGEQLRVRGDWLET